MASATPAGPRTAVPLRKTLTRTATAPGGIVVVHNGIVENYLALKQELMGQGHKFVTETDTEIIAHLIEQEIRCCRSGKTMPLEEAVRARRAG